jgi:Cu-Zn family superoxide dismutase
MANFGKNDAMKTNIFFLLMGFVAITGCKTKADDPQKTAGSKAIKMKIDFTAISGSKASGNALFIEENGKVTFTAHVNGLKPGIHAIHIHEKADCNSPDGKSAGGHWNPTFKDHGKWGAAAYHKGDIGNFTADADGKGTITMTTNEWCIGCGDPKKDILGKGLIVHEDPDDYTSQPAGNAGTRIACSAIIK